MRNLLGPPFNPSHLPLTCFQAAGNPGLAGGVGDGEGSDPALHVSGRGCGAGRPSGDTPECGDLSVRPGCLNTVTFYLMLMKQPL